MRRAWGLGDPETEGPSNPRLRFSHRGQTGPKPLRVYTSVSGSGWSSRGICAALPWSQIALIRTRVQPFSYNMPWIAASAVRYDLLQPKGCLLQ